ncbi:MAG: lysylphosphatidylglycerol synthase transmembrane domain-containing protein [bacterium]
MISPRVRRAVSVLWALALVALLVVAIRRMDVARLILTLRDAHLFWIACAAAAYATILPLWALQWRILAPRVPRAEFPGMLSVVALTSSALNTSPLFVGEATSVVLLVSRIGLSRSEALSVLAMDQVMVGISKLGLLLAAGLMVTLPAWMHAGIATLAAGVIALVVASVLGAWYSGVIVSRAARVLPQRGAEFLAQMGVALAPLRSPVRSGLTLSLAFAKKFAEVIALICVQHAFGVHLPFAAAVLALAAIKMATLIPAVPASLGVFEGAVVLAYVRFGVPAEQAVAMAIVQHATYFASLALPGYAWLAGSGTSRRAAAAS